MVFVVSVHTLAFGGGTVTMSIGAVTTIFHTSRELFLLLTALVLTYNYGHRDRLKAGRFWRRRFWLVVPAYVTWSAIYYAADGRGRGAFPAAFVHDLLNAGARYHLYFLLVSMQIYLLFPLIRWVLRKTERHHGWLFGVALGYQVWLTIGLHYKVGRHGNGPLAQFLNGAGQGYWVDTYVFYVVAGALAGWHFERLCAFTRRYLRSGPRVALAAAVGVAAGIGVFLDRDRGLRRHAGQRERGLPAGRHLRGARLRLGAARRRAAVERPGRAGAEVLRRGVGQLVRHLPRPPACPAGAAACRRVERARRSTAASSARCTALHRSSVLVLVLLFIAVPLIYAVSWLIASAARRTPVSLLLTGREWKPKRKTRIGQATDRALDKIEDTGHRQGQAGAPARPGHRARRRRAGGRRVDRRGCRSSTRPSATINSTTSTMQVGSMTRSYTVLTPAKTALPASAPIIMVLSGLNAEPAQEITRDQLTPYVSSGQGGTRLPAGLPGVVERDRLLLLGGHGPMSTTPGSSRRW